MTILFEVKVFDANGNLIKIISQEEVIKRHWKIKKLSDRYFKSRERGIKKNMKDADKEINFKTTIPA
jgi:hypothetical protein